MAALGPCGYSKARFNLPGQGFETKGCSSSYSQEVWTGKKVLKWQKGCLGTHYGAAKLVTI